MCVLFVFWFPTLYERQSTLSLLCVFVAERQEMISCVYVSREGETVAVAFSKPDHVSPETDEAD